MTRTSGPAAGNMMRALTLVLAVGLGPAVAGCGKPEAAPTPADSGRKAGPDGVAPQDKGAPTDVALPTGGDPDLARLQGVWAVEKYDAGNPITAPPEAVLKTMRYTFEGNTIRTKMEAAGTFTENLTFDLDSASRPKSMRVTRLGGDGKPIPRADSVREVWIYKLVGDTLTLATGDEKHRPNDFLPKPSAGRRPGTAGSQAETTEPYVPAVDVVRLKKTTDPAVPPRP